MSVIFLLIIFSLLLALLFLFAFIWSVKDGQYEDDYTPSVRMLFDEEQTQTSSLINPSKDALAETDFKLQTSNYKLQTNPE